MKPIEIRYKADRKFHRHSDFYPYLVVFDQPTNPQAGTIHQSIMLKAELSDADELTRACKDTIKDSPAKLSWALPGDHLGELITEADLPMTHQAFVARAIKHLTN